LNLGLHACKTGILPLEPHLQSILLLLFFWRWGGEVLQTICLGWLQNSILPVSASQVARITGVSHRCPALAKYSYSHILVWEHLLWKYT
jgi:hypothetical protein